MMRSGLKKRWPPITVWPRWRVTWNKHGCRWPRPGGISTTFFWVSKRMKNSFKQRSILAFGAGLVALAPLAVMAQAAHDASAVPGQVVITGTLPDDASKLAILSKLREIYGANRVVDQLTVGAVVTPPNWTTYVQKLISPTLKLVN